MIVKLLCMLPFLLFSINSLAECRVYIPEKVFYHDSGFVINFHFDALLNKKNFSEVSDASNYDYILSIEGRELAGRFRKAQAIITMHDLRSEHVVTCLTIACSITDFAKAFNKAYEAFSQKLKVCEPRRP